MANVLEPLSQALSHRVRHGCARLGEAAATEISGFVQAQSTPEGAFRGRGRTGADLYYAVFGLECARALNLSLAWGDTAAYLERQTDSAYTLDLVHLSCLIRAWRLLAENDPRARRHATVLCDRLDAFRCADGGYAAAPIRPQTRGEIYALFLAGLAYGAAGRMIPSPRRAIRTISALATPDGAFANHPGVTAGTTTVTAAAVIMLAAAKASVPAETRAWLLARQDAAGGFRAGPDAPIPDLLSTATALLALTRLGVRLPADATARCAEFVESLWDESGGFCGSPPDPVADLEYTYYALLALGCLGPEMV